MRKFSANIGPIPLSFEVNQVHVVPYVSIHAMEMYEAGIQYFISKDNHQEFDRTRCGYTATHLKNYLARWSYSATLDEDCHNAAK